MPIYEIRVQGRLDQRWSTWFDGLTISYEGEDSTVLRGSIVDEAALHGILSKVRDLALPLLAVSRVAAAGQDSSSPEPPANTKL
jgi:hypothetical protein